MTVNKNGLLAAKKNGSATITVTSLADESVYTTINLTVKAPSIFLLQVRKIIGHFGLFFVLAILGTLSLFMLIKDKKFGMLINLFCGILTASVAEILQLPIFVAGRFASFADVIINFSGYLVGSIFTLLSMHMIAKIKASRKTIQPPTKQN